MTRRLVVEEEERLDRIARAAYGTERGGALEALLNANQGLAATGGIVPAGREIVVPDTVSPGAPAATRPWI